MKRHGSDIDPEIEALLKPHRIQRHVPPELRARVLARARATLAGEPIRPAHVASAPVVPLVRGRHLLRVAVAASVVIAGAAAGAVAGLRLRSAPAPQVAPASVPAERGPLTKAAGAAIEAPSPAAVPVPVKPPHSSRAGGKTDPFTAELELMQRAQAAFTRHDFSVALTVIAEHTRRFPRGQLAEQREALRVRSLLGAGRGDEAHRAAAAFAVRFPRSVLLPRVQAGPEGSESSNR
jgi:hypothetical protein